MAKYKSDLIFFVGLAAGIFAVWYLSDVVLPFAIGFLLAYVCNPMVEFIMKFIKNRSLAVAVFLILVIGIFVGATWLTADMIVDESVRLGNSVKVLAEANKEDLDKATQFIMGYVEMAYKSEEINESVNSDSIKGSLQSIAPFMKSGINSLFNSINSIFVLISALIYFLFMLFDFKSVSGNWKNYLSGERKDKVLKVLTDVENSFVVYFKQRTKILLILMVVYIVGFLIIGIPGCYYSWNCDWSFGVYTIYSICWTCSSIVGLFCFICRK